MQAARVQTVGSSPYPRAPRYKLELRHPGQAWAHCPAMSLMICENERLLPLQVQPKGSWAIPAKESFAAAHGP